jgi:hypothetical protein
MSSELAFRWALALSVFGLDALAQEPSYAGAKACKACHAGIYRDQEQSPHALSLRPATEVSEWRSALPFQIVDAPVNARLQVYLSQDSGLDLSAARDATADHVSAEWAFGSGVKGITPVGRRPDGRFIEMRLSWYRSLQGFDFTTGAASYEPTTVSEALGRSLTSHEIGQCFGCHTTGYDPQRQMPERSEMGIRCERCHGPGLRHVTTATAGRDTRQSIVHPGKLGAFSQARMCGECHGRPPADNEFEALAYIERTPLTVRFPSQRLVLTRCFNESQDRLKCTSCHNPHRSAKQQAERYDAACISCYSTTATVQATVCRTRKRACASCHMPLVRVMRNSEFTDHWIRVVRSSKS